MGLFPSVICRFGAGELIAANPDCSLSQINITHTHTVVDWRCLFRLCWSNTLYSQNWTIGSAKKWSSYGLTFLWGAIANDLITLIVFGELSFMQAIYKFQSQTVPVHRMEDTIECRAERKVPSWKEKFSYNTSSQSPRVPCIKELTHSLCKCVLSILHFFLLVIIKFNAFWKWVLLPSGRWQLNYKPTSMFSFQKVSYLRRVHL